MTCNELSMRTGRPCALPAGHGREQHLDTVEMRAEMDGMCAAFAMGMRDGMRDARARREREALACIGAMGDDERGEFFAGLRLAFCIHCGRGGPTGRCHCTNDE